MKVLNIYHSTTGNTEKVARVIEKTVREAGHEVDLIKASAKAEVDLLAYDFIFAGSGVYEWLPGKPLQELFTKIRKKYFEMGEIRLSAPRRANKKAVIYCTYGGAHTGINEAIPAVKYMGQLFDHLGFEILDEWYFVGEYHPKKYKEFSVGGRLGDIGGRPNEQDLHDVSERVRGILCV